MKLPLLAGTDRAIAAACSAVSLGCFFKQGPASRPPKPHGLRPCGKRLTGFRRAALQTLSPVRGTRDSGAFSMLGHWTRKPPAPSWLAQ